MSTANLSFWHSELLERLSLLSLLQEHLPCSIVEPDSVPILPNNQPLLRNKRVLLKNNLTT
jgi:hypothetical protein